MASKNITSLSVSLIARMGSFAKGMRKAKKLVIGVAQAARTAAIGTAALGAAAATAAVAGIAKLTKDGLAFVDTQAKMAARLGLTTEALVGLQHAAGLSGVKTKALNVGLQRMTRRVAAAAGGNKGLIKILKELGLEAGELAAMSPDKQFMAIADAMKQVGTDGEKVLKTFGLFDTEGVGLKVLLEQGSDAIRDMLQDAHQLGLTFNRLDARKVENANDAFSRLGAIWQGLKNTLAIQLAPLLEFVTMRIVDFIKESGGLRQIVSAGFLVAVQAVDKLTAALLSLQVAYHETMLGIEGTSDVINSFAAENSGLTKRLLEAVPGLSAYAGDLEREIIKSAAESTQGILDRVEKLNEAERKLRDLYAGASFENRINEILAEADERAAESLGIGLGEQQRKEADVTRTPDGRSQRVTDKQVVDKLDELIQVIVGNNFTVPRIT